MLQPKMESVFILRWIYMVKWGAIIYGEKKRQITVPLRRAGRGSRLLTETTSRPDERHCGNPQSCLDGPEPGHIQDSNM